MASVDSTVPDDGGEMDREIKSLHPLLYHKTPKEMYDELKEPLPFHHPMTKVNSEHSLGIVVSPQRIRFDEWQHFFAFFPEFGELRIGEWKEKKDVSIESKIQEELKSIEFEIPPEFESKRFNFYVTMNYIIDGTSRKGNDVFLLTEWIAKGLTNSDYNIFIRYLVKNFLPLSHFEGEHKKRYYDIYKNLLKDIIRYGAFSLFVSLFTHLYETDNRYVHSIYEDNTLEFLKLSCVYQNTYAFSLVSSESYHPFQKTKTSSSKSFVRLSCILPSKSAEAIEYFIKLSLTPSVLLPMVSLCCHNSDWKKLQFIKKVLKDNWNFSDKDVKDVLFPLFPDTKKRVWICVSLCLSAPSV